jgi:hypothetical protein
MGRLRASAFRFSKNIRASWEREIRKEVERSNAWMDEFPPADATGAQAADGFIQLRRTRSNEWFDSIRAVFAPAALLKEGIGETVAEDASAVLREARSLVIERGTAAYDGSIGRVAERLVQAGTIAKPEDVTWLEYGEVRDALAHGGAHQAAVEKRRAEHAARPTGPRGPEPLGPPLPPNAPRMYLIREVLALIADGSA